MALALVRITREIERYILRPPKFVRMRVRVRIRVHVTGGVLARGLTCVGRLSEQPHWRWPKQGAAVAKQGGLGELSGLCKVYRPKRRPAEGMVLFRPIMWLYPASVVLGSTLHLALAIIQQGIPRFGHRLFFFPCVCLHWALSLARHGTAIDFAPDGVCGGHYLSLRFTSTRVQSRFGFVELGGDMYSNCQGKVPG